jgi:threonine dehydratase
MDSRAAETLIRPYVRETPFTESRQLGATAKSRVFLKLENLQETSSFKLRGAAAKLLSMPREEIARGIVVASTGNHGIATSTIGRKLKIPVDIYVSDQLHPGKRSKIESLGARVHTVPGDPLLAEITARREAVASGRPYVSPYNDRDVVAGQGTVAVEILRQLGNLGITKLDAIFVAVGGGGLIGGIGIHLKHESPESEVVGCWPENSPALHECMRAGRFLDVFTDKPTYSTSTAGGVEPGAITLEIARRTINRSILVTEAEILDATRRFFREEGQVIEGAAGVAVAAYLKNAADYAGKTVAIVICGGNLDPAFEALVKA